MVIKPIVYTALRRECLAQRSRGLAAFCFGGDDVAGRAVLPAIRDGVIILRRDPGGCRCPWEACTAKESIEIGLLAINQTGPDGVGVEEYRTALFIDATPEGFVDP
jgi:hypothetical protein